MLSIFKGHRKVDRHSIHSFAKEERLTTQGRGIVVNTARVIAKNSSIHYFSVKKASFFFSTRHAKHAPRSSEAATTARESSLNKQCISTIKRFLQMKDHVSIKMEEQQQQLLLQLQQQQLQQQQDIQEEEEVDASATVAAQLPDVDDKDIVASNNNNNMMPMMTTTTTMDDAITWQEYSDWVTSVDCLRKWRLWYAD
jgi:ATP-dependent Lon protease